MNIFKGESFIKFTKQFPDDLSCKAYLADIKWVDGYKCKKCEHINYPSRKVCVQCGSQELEEHQMSSTGTVLSFIVNHYLPKEFDKPLAIGVVELDGFGYLWGVI